MTRLAASILLIPALLGSREALAKSPGPRSITIQSVSLADELGQWKTIIEPDKLVDLDKDDPGLSFFNNGRVEPGRYLNFELIFVRTNEGIPKRVTSRQALSTPLEVKRGSFIGVWFWLSKPELSLEKLELTVDESTKVFAAEDLLEEKK